MFPFWPRMVVDGGSPHGLAFPICPFAQEAAGETKQLTRKEAKGIRVAWVAGYVSWPEPGNKWPTVQRLALLLGGVLHPWFLGCWTSGTLQRRGVQMPKAAYWHKQIRIVKKKAEWLNGAKQCGQLYRPNVRTSSMIEVSSPFAFTGLAAGHSSDRPGSSQV